MQRIKNNFILDTKTINEDGITVTYRLFENSDSFTPRYSALISAQKSNGETEDFFIDEFSFNKRHAIALFNKLYENTVLPCEIEILYSDGFDSIIDEIL